MKYNKKLLVATMLLINSMIAPCAVVADDMQEFSATDMEKETEQIPLIQKDLLSDKMSNINFNDEDRKIVSHTETTEESSASNVEKPLESEKVDNTSEDISEETTNSDNIENSSTSSVEEVLDSTGEDNTSNSISEIETSESIEAETTTSDSMSTENLIKETSEDSVTQHIFESGNLKCRLDKKSSELYITGWATSNRNINIDKNFVSDAERQTQSKILFIILDDAFFSLTRESYSLLIGSDITPTVRVVLSNNRASFKLRDSSNLKRVDFGKADFGIIQEYDSMFYNCRTLESVKIKNISPTNASNMFALCSKLSYVEITTSTNTLNNTQKMFNSSTGNSPLLVVSNNQKILDYDYTNDNRKPYLYSIKANGGVFADGSSEDKKYFDSCAVRPNDPRLDLKNIENFRTENTPTRSNHVFVGWTGLEQPASITDLANNVNIAQWISDDFDWKITEKNDYILLEKYIGRYGVLDNNINVPNEVKGKPTKLQAINLKVIPNLYTLESFNVLPTNKGGTVELVSNNLSYAFSAFTPSTSDKPETNVKRIDLSGLDTKNVTDMSFMFAGCSNLNVLNLDNLNTSQVKNMKYMFYGCQRLSTLDVDGFNTSNVEDMGFMFYGCSKQTNLDVSMFDTTKVKIMTAMFAYNSNLIDLRLGNWTTTNVSDMSWMFYNCSRLPQLDVTNFETNIVKSMYNMFANCRSLTELDLTNFNTDSVQVMKTMFSNCTNLTTLKLDNINTELVTDMSGMFAGCNQLEKLDLRSFDTNRVENMNGMFSLESSTPLLVITNDNNLLKYRYETDNRTPLTNPVFNANGGKFADSTTKKSYFGEVANRTESFDLKALKKFQKENIPIKSGAVFRGWNLVKGGTPNPNNVLDLLDAEYEAQWSNLDINIPHEEDNTKPSELTEYGIAYMPKSFVFESTELLELGEQLIPLNDQSRNYHVAVRDRRMISEGWELRAQLVWENEKKLPGAEIVTSHEGNKVQKNINDGSQEFSINDLIDCPISEVRAEQGVAIGSGGSTLLMTAQKIEHDAVYDYDLGNITLRLPEAKFVQPREYNGYVEWSLSNAP
ncbi:BspA family leucine-rich repeat surface protein [Staphylococcus aureus]|uniref:BspA family leucine-rich repeat surface protein n=1 Tax=Staphylococcus aureus TaxID=1280 RepID=UPI004040364E